MSDVLNSAAAVAGLIPVVGAPISAAIQIADALGIGSWLTQHVLGSNGAAVAQQVVQAVATATGGEATPAAIAGLAPDARAALQVRLAEIAAQQQQAADAARLETFKAQLSDISSARGQTVSLAQAGSKVQFAAPAVSVMVMLTFGVLAWAVMWRAVPAGSEGLAMGLVETAKLLCVTVVSYWCGSSAGSAAKTDMIYNSTPNQGGGVVSRPLGQ